MNPLSPTRTAPASRPPPTEINSITNNRWGGVVGVGAEWAVGGGWTLKSETLYMHFTQQQDRLVSPAFAPGVPVFTNTDNAVVARVGFNYIFGPFSCLEGPSGIAFKCSGPHAYPRHFDRDCDSPLQLLLSQADQGCRYSI